MPFIIDAPARQVPFTSTATQDNAQVQSTAAVGEEDVRS